MSRIVRIGFAALVLAALSLFAAPQPSVANPYFAKQTGQPCAACHQPGQENLGAAGLNPTGLAFKACGEQPSCIGLPNGQQQFRLTTATQGGLASFHHKGCGHRPRYVTIRLAGTVPVGLVLDRGMEIHIVVSQNSTWASSCHGFPGDGASYALIDLDSN